MESFKDLVSGQACDDGSGSSAYRNPLGRFVDRMFNDKSREHAEYRDKDLHRQQQFLNTKHEIPLETQTSQHVSNFLTDNFANPMRMERFNNIDLTEDDLEEFMRTNPNGMMPLHEEFERLNLSREVPPDLLKDYIKSFIDSSHQQSTFRPVPLPDFGLTEVDKAKIRSRSEMLAKQMFADQTGQFVENQLGAFLDPLHLSNGPQHRFMHSKFAPDELVKEFDQYQNEPMPFHEMEHIYRNSVETNKMANEFEDFKSHQEMEKYYAEAQETEKWVDEFEGIRPIDRVNNKNLKDLTGEILEIDDPKLQRSGFMNFIKNINEGRVEFRDNEVVEKSKEEVEADLMAKEFEEYSTPMNPNQWADDFMQRFGDGKNEFTEQEEWIREFNSMYSTNPDMNEYQFSNPLENPYMDLENPFQEGQKLFAEGRVSDAILAFEAELQRNPENAQGWQYLGQAHAENDKDGKAITALLKAIEKDPQNTDAMLTLGVSFTNEMFRDEALDTLKKWIEFHPNYKHIKYIQPDFEDGYFFKKYHNAITEMLVSAALMKPDNPDPDVQTALGLLYNLSMDYDKAVECFKSALSVKPDDYLLWNKLGATLANSQRSAEALGCYFRALQIKPSYVRARVNLGISFMALNENHKAAQYFLGALNMHPQATHIWTNLQMVFLAMEKRPDLLEKAAQMNIELFRDEFEF